MKVFYKDDSVSVSNSKMIRMKDEFYKKFNGTSGSFNVFMARLFNLSYANFLRMARDVYGADLNGKRGGYITMTFKDGKNCDRLVNELNKRWECLLKAL